MTTGSKPTLKGLAALSSRRPLLTSVFAAAVILTCIFAVKSAVHFSYWNEHRLRPVSPWMSPNYIARVWKLDTQELQDVLGTTGETQNNRSLTGIAIQQGKSPRSLVNYVEELIQDEYGDPPS